MCYKSTLNEKAHKNLNFFCRNVAFEVKNANEIAPPPVKICVFFSLLSLQMNV